MEAREINRTYEAPREHAGPAADLHPRLRWQSAFVIVFGAACMVAAAGMTWIVLTRGVPNHVNARPALNLPTPPFQLVGIDGQPFDSTTLAGKTYVIGFTFTRCQLVCPVMNGKMLYLQEQLAGADWADDVRLVSVTVDPEHDTPQVLAAHAQRIGADPARWTHLTGDRDTIWRLSEEGYKLPVGAEPDNPLMPIGHSAKFALVDANGLIIDYYNSQDASEVERLLVDLEQITIGEKGS